MSDEVVALKTSPESRLTPRELAAYRTWSKLGQVRLGPTIQEQLFELFLQGKDCTEIVKLNKGISLAQVVTARIESGWDAAREEYVQNLMLTTRAKLQQSTLESVQFMADILAVAHRKYGSAAKMYIQTGDEKYLKGFDVGSIGQYYKVVEILQKLSGAENQPRKTEEKVSGDIVHHHLVEPAPLVPVVVDAAALIRGKLGT